MTNRHRPGIFFHFPDGSVAALAQSAAGKGGDGRLSGKRASEEKEEAWYAYTNMFICRERKTTGLKF
jgi:hypothetical protein